MTTDQIPSTRTEISARLMAVAEHTIVAEWICCEPLDPTHDLCAKGYATLEMTRALLVDDPEASVTAAPLLDAVMGLLPAAVPVPPPAGQTAVERALDALKAGNHITARYLLESALSPAAEVLAVLPEQTDRAAEAPAAECSAQNRNYESGPRLCIRAAQHHGDHIDGRGFHWSDTVAVYPVSDGTFRRGTDVRALLRRVAAEEQPTERPRCPHCQMPHDLAPGMSLACASIRASIRDQQGPETQEARCPAKHGALGRICELPPGHSGMHTGSGPNGGAVWQGDAP